MRVVLLTVLFLIVNPHNSWSQQTFWQQTNGPEGGLVFSILHMGNGDILCGTQNGGVYRSTDNGESWAATNEGMGNQYVAHLMKNDSEEIFAATSGGVYRSSNGGDSWVHLYKGLTSQYVEALAINSGGTIFAGTNSGGMFKSDDNGDNWAEINNGLSELKIRDVLIASNGYIYLGTYDGGVFRSLDNGDSWQEKNDGFTNVYIWVLSELPNGHIIAGSHGSGFFLSNNKGDSWTQGSITGGYFTCFAKNSAGAIYAGTRSGIYYSTDNAANWGLRNNGLPDTDISSISVNSADEVFTGANRRGIAYSDDNGLNWQSKIGGLKAETILKVNYGPGNLILAGSFSYLYRSNDYGLTWNLTGPSDIGTIQDIAVNKNDEIFVAFAGGGVHRSVDVGATWTYLPNGMTDYYVQALAINPSGHIFAGTRGGVFRSTDNGQNWLVKNGGLSTLEIHDIAINSDGYIFVGNIDGVYKSTNNGESWQLVISGMTAHNISALAINSKGYIFAGDGNGGGLYRSANNGDTWALTQLQDVFVASLAINSEDHLVANNGWEGVVYSKDDGASWEPLNGGLDFWPEDLIFDDQGHVIAGTRGGSVFRSTVPLSAVKVRFEVRMRYQDGFDPARHQVSVRGKFNETGDDLVLEPQGDADMTYIGEWITANPDSAITDGHFEYKFVVLGDPEIPEFLPNRMVPWDGQEDLILEPVWFDDQFEFTRMITGEMVLDTTTSRGVAWGDYDKDGFPDLYVSNFGQKDFLYHNNGNGELVKEIEFSEERMSYSVSWGDYDNDEDLDLFVSDLGGENNLRFENTGIGGFNKLTAGPEVSEGGNSFGALWFDYDQDGFVDLFASNLSNENNYLYHNLGDNTFEKIITGPVVLDTADSRGASAADFDNDGDMDLFVANAGTLPGAKNFLYINQGDGTFIPAPPGNPVVDDVGTAWGGSWGDYDNDGLLDLYVANIGDGQPNMLYKNMGEGVFNRITTSIVSSDSGASRSTSWIDFDNDGWLDLFVLNSGPNILYRNTGDGNFERIEYGPVVNDALSSRGCAWADYDRDGDPDVVITDASNRPNYVYRNNLQGQNWSEYKLIGTISNKAAIGARVKLKITNNEGNPMWQMREISSQTGLLGQNEMIAHFGLGKATSIDSVIVVWPGGNRQIIIPPGINKRISVIETTPEYPVPILVSPKNGVIDVDLYPEFIWNPADGVISYTLQLSTSSDFSDFVINEENLTGTNYQMSTVGPPLQTVTNHFWRVKAVMNTSSAGNWSDVWNFTTKRDTTFEQVLEVASPPDSATNVSRTPTLEWAWIDAPPVGDIITYDVQISDSPEFKDTLWQVIDVSGPPVTVSDYELEYNKSYFWRARAKTSSTIYIWSDPPWMFTTEPFTGKVNLLYPENNAANVSVPTPLMWTSVPADGYVIQVATSTDFGNLVIDVNSTPEDTLIYINQSMEFTTNSQYFWRVGVISGGNVPLGNWTIPYMFETFDDKVEADFFLRFPEHERRDEYRATDFVIVGLPGNSGMAFNQVFTGVAGEDWMAYWDNGNTNASQPEDYLIPYKISSTFTFTTGRAFWVINKGDIRVNPSDLGGFPLNEMAEAEIHVHAGYNLITCPFDKPVSWSQVKVLNGLPDNTPLWEFDNDQNKFLFSSTLEPGMGYYFLNSANISPLRVPFNPIYGFLKAVVDNALDWQVRINLESGESGDGTSRIGISGEAEIGLDQLEYNKPRMLQGIASVYFERPEWDENYSIFGSDVRPEINESETWVMKVYAPDAAKSQLSFSGIEDIPVEYEVFLLDKKAARVQDLREKEIYHFTPLAEITEFELMVGHSENINDRIAEIIPQDFALEQNYPNPFNPTTILPIALPKASQIKVTIYNILGKVINVVYNGIAESGRHYMRWDGTDVSGKRVASGLYFYRLEIEGHEAYTKKMVLIK
jgi:photosystem II stability/assembly factor-like uncharacterized protein